MSRFTVAFAAVCLLSVSQPASSFLGITTTPSRQRPLVRQADREYHVPLSVLSLSSQQQQQQQQNKNHQRRLKQQHEQQPQSTRSSRVLYSSSSSSSSNEEEPCWNPKLRRTLGTIALAGVAETSYLTFTKLFTDSQQYLFCGATTAEGAASNCGSVLTGPYSVIPFTSIPLAALGLLAYSTVAVLALGPIFQQKQDGEKTTVDDTDNRIMLVAVTTAMGVFSVFLITFLFGVLHESCVYCIASAVFSISLAKLSWLGGVAPSQPLERAKQAIQMSVSTSLIAVVAATALFLNVGDVEDRQAEAFVGTSNSLAAATSQAQLPSALTGPFAPPAIPTSSSPRALKIAKQLQALDAHFYGAYWCSHCFDQKSELGKEAMQLIPYVECSKEGLNANVQLCKDKKVPGYPTWEIKGKLYPGQKELEELEEIIADSNSKL